jgi:hypothetical protein
VRVTSLSISFVKITEIYTHLTEKHIWVVRSPLDVLAQAHFCGKSPEVYDRLTSPRPTKSAGAGADPGVSFFYGGFVMETLLPTGKKSSCQEQDRQYLRGKFIRSSKLKGERIEVPDSGLKVRD